MMQSLHIFRKDVRHLWPELTLYVALLAGFAWIKPQLWLVGGGAPDSTIELLSGLLQTLIPILWLVMIVRLVHDESLVGDRQFWITRPYSRVSLIAAKLGFMVVCVVLPFLVMQWSLILQADLHPLGTLRGLMHSLPVFAEFTWIPFFAVAVVTASLGRAFMSLIGAVLTWIAILALSGSTGPLMTPTTLFDGYAILLFCVVVGVVIYQYMVRDTKRSRAALIAALVVTVGLFGCFTRDCFHGVVDAAVRRQYPADTSIHLSFDSSVAGYGSRTGRAAASRGWVPLSLPVQLQGLGPTARIHEPNASFTLDSPGYRYESPWRPVGFDGRGLSLLVPAEVFNRMQGGEVHLHVSFATEKLAPAAPEVVTAAEHFSVPDQGNCVLTEPEGRVICRYGFEGPSPTGVSGPVTKACGDGTTATTSQGTGALHAWAAGSRPDPVMEEPLTLGGMVCPGAQLSFVAYHSVGQFRAELDIPAVTLGHYRTD
jgi:hypothetical protein